VPTAVGLHNSNAVDLTHSLRKAPGFNPRAYDVKSRFPKFAFSNSTCVPLHNGANGQIGQLRRELHLDVVVFKEDGSFVAKAPVTVPSDVTLGDLKVGLYKLKRLVSLDLYGLTWQCIVGLVSGIASADCFSSHSSVISWFHSNFVFSNGSTGVPLHPGGHRHQH
jgi:hypothetical protein